MGIARVKAALFGKKTISTRIAGAPGALVERLEGRVLLSAAAQRAAAELTVARLNLPAPQIPRQVHLLNPERGQAKSALAGSNPLQTALDHLRRNAGKYGLTAADVADPLVTDQYTDTDTGVTHIYLRQRYKGTEVANAELSVHVGRDGKVLYAAGGFVPDFAGKLKASLATAPSLARATPGRGADQALFSAARSVGYVLSKQPIRVSSTKRVARVHPIFRAREASLDDVTGKLEYVMSGDQVRLAWELVMRTPDQQHWYSISVDADNGTTLHGVVDWVSHASASYNVYPAPVETPVDGSRQVLTDPHDPIVSPFGWHDTDGADGIEYTDTRGNNVFAQEDADANNSGGYRPSGGAAAPLSFDTPVDLTQSPTTYRDAAITNLFYWTNVMHDAHARYGFTEAAGNFQVTNYTGQGIGNDALQADAQDGSGYNNANMATPADGSAPRMQMYLWNKTSPYRDGDFDSMIIAHEYGHGVSNRLTGGPANANALTATQSRAMGEGWSDWWALMFTMKATDSKSLSYPVGAYVTNTTAGIRRYPYAYDMTVDPLTYSSIKVSSEEHDAGEIWTSVLLDMTWLLVDRYGMDSDVLHGYSASDPNRDGGNNLALKLVEDGLKLQPANPSYLAARDGILAADLALTGGQNMGLIWSAFARRGMGNSASDGGSSSSTNVVDGFDIPLQFRTPQVVSMSPTIAATTPIEYIDITFSEAMNPATFSLTQDVTSFVSPTGQDLMGNITLGTWNASNTVLRLSFATPLATDGTYALTIGPDIRSADDNTPMDQDQDSVAGEAVQDQYVAKFVYDAVLMSVVSTNPANGSVVTLPLTSLELNFNEPFKASTVGTSDLVLSRGVVSQAEIVDADTVRYTLTSIAGETDLIFSVAAGALQDLNGRPCGAFSGALAIEAGTIPFPSTFSAQNPLGSLHFSASTNATIGYGGDRDSYTVYLEGGQLLSAWIDPAASIQARVELFDPNGNSMAMATSSGPGKDAYLSAAIPSSGTYTVSVLGLGNTTGNVTLGLSLNAALEAESRAGAANDSLSTAQNLDGAFASLANGASRAVVSGSSETSADYDYYAVNLNAGQMLSLWQYTSSGNGALYFYDGSGNELTRSIANGNNRYISDFKALSTGTYYVKSSGLGSTYNLYLLRNGSGKNGSSNSTIGTAIPVRLVDPAGTQSIVGYYSVGYPEFYAVNVSSGQAVTFSSGTPHDGAGLPDNQFNPRLRLMDASGAVLASDDNSAPDGRNAVLSYSPTNSGTLYLEVSSVSSPDYSGHYVISASGLVSQESFTATWPSVTNGARVSIAPTTVNMDFSNAFLISSVQASDVTVDGIPATNVTITDHNTLQFTIPSRSAAGAHVLSIAAGAITDIRGNGVAAFNSTFIVDTVAPRVIASSLQNKQTIPSGSFSCVLTFDEAMRSMTDPYYAQVKGLDSATNYSATSLVWSGDGTTLTLTFSSLKPDRYTLTLTSNYAFADLAGNYLDGETQTYMWPIPSGKSGNGVAGGDFVINFVIDPSVATAFPTLVLSQPEAAPVWENYTYADITVANDIDYYTIDLDGGQTLTVVADPSSTLQTTLQVTGPTGEVLASGQSQATGGDAFLQNIAIATSGTYTVAVGGASNTSGSAKVELILNASTELEAREGAFNNSFDTAEVLTLTPDLFGMGSSSARVYGQTSSGDADYYAMDLTAGDTVSVAVGSSGSPTLRFYDSTGKVLAYPFSYNYTYTIRDFTVKTSGRYYASVSTSSTYSYALQVLTNGSLVLDSISSTSSACTTLANPVGKKQFYSGYLTSYDYEYYQVFVRAGDTITLSTATPLDGPLQPTNGLDPRLTLFNASGTQIAQDSNSASDGRNAVLNYTASADTVLYVEVDSTASTSGNYVLTIEGATLNFKPLTVSTSSVAEGRSYSSIGTLSMNFSNPLDLTTVGVDDLLLDGQPMASFSLYDADTIQFTVPAGYATGAHTLSMAAGAIKDINGIDVSAFVVNFTVDKTPPRIVGSSMAPNALVPAGDLTYTVTFSEPMSSSIDATDLLLSGQYAVATYTANSLAWNADRTALTIKYLGLGEDHYSLTLTSGSLAFADSAGNYLDGESTPSSWPMPPGSSGDGTAGGSFVLPFDVADAGPAALPAASRVSWPRGGAAYRSSGNGVIGLDDVDQFTIDLDDGQLASVSVSPTVTTLAPVVDIVGPDGKVLRSASAVAGSAVSIGALSINTSGRYTIRVSGGSGTTGKFSLELLLNAVREGENQWSLANDTRASATSLDSAFINYGGGTRQATVLGNNDLVATTLPSEVEPNNTLAGANQAIGNFQTVGGSIYQLSVNGSFGKYSDYDYYKIGSLQPGDVISVNVAAVGSGRGSATYPYVDLVRGSSYSVAYNSGTGPGNDALIDRYAITADDIYYIRVSSNSYTNTGSYQLNVLLANSGTAPATTGNVTAEVEGNDSTYYATDLSTSWRQVNYHSVTTGSVSNGDPDIFAYYFSADNVVTFGLNVQGTATTLSVYDASGTRISFDDGYSYPVTSFPMRISQSGMYYVMVSSTTTKAYTLDVQLSAPSTPPQLSNGLDFYSMHLDFGERVQISAESTSASAMSLLLLDETGQTIAAGELIDNAVLIRNFNSGAEGTYYLQLAGGTGTPYALTVTRNGMTDLEQTHMLTRPQVISTNERIVGSLALSALTTRFDEKFESGALSTKWSTYSNNYGRVRVTNAYAAAGGTYFLSMDTASTYSYSLNEAIMTVDLQGAEQATLSFYHNGFSDSNDGMPYSPFNDHANGDGIAISMDGTKWYSVWSAPSTSGWVLFTVDLALAARSKGLVFNEQTRVKFQQYGYYPLTSGGRGWDNITVSAAGAKDDYYAVDLHQGDRIDLATLTPFDGPKEPANLLDPKLELMSPEGVILGTDDNSGSDGRNAKLSCVAATTGRYRIHVSSASTTGDYLLDVSTRTTIDPPPLRPDLVSASDSGVSNSDDVTRLNNADGASALSFQISGVTAGAQVVLYADGRTIGSAVATSDSVQVTTDGQLLLEDGVHSITARQTPAGGTQSVESPALTILVDSSAPLPAALPSLDVSSDSGVVGDNVTSDNTPALLVPLPATGYYRVYRDDVLISGLYEQNTLLTLPALADGLSTLYLVAVDRAGNESIRSAGLNLVVDTVSPAAPVAALDLRASSDTGISDTDNVTADNTPTFSVPARSPGSAGYRVYRNGSLFSSAFESSNVFTAPLCADGTYQFTFVSVDAAGNESAQSPAITVTIDATAPASPVSAMRLVPTSDRGFSSTDNLTTASPVFDMSGMGSARYRIYRDGTLISGLSETSTTFATSDQPSGSHAYTCTIIDDAGNESLPSAAIMLTIDASKPTVQVMPLPAKAAPHELYFTFSEDVRWSLSAGDLVIRPTGGGAAFSPDNVSYDPATNTARFTFTLRPADGNYTATLNLSDVQDAAGNLLAGGVTTDFYVFKGDANRDRVVDVSDLALLAAHYGMSGNLTWVDGDFTGDGVVDVSDLAQMAANYGSILPAPLPAVNWV